MHFIVIAVVMALAVIADAVFPAAAEGVRQPYACVIQPDAKTVRVSISNPFKTETHCQVNCQFATDRGSSFQISCTKVVEAGGKQTELCVKTYDKGNVVRMTGGSAECIRPLEDAAATEKDDDEDIAALIDATKIRERTLRQMPPEARRMLEQM